MARDTNSSMKDVVLLLRENTYLLESQDFKTIEKKDNS